MYIDNKCVVCNRERTAEGHDPCLGTIPGPIKNACCGHSHPQHAYIQFDNPSYKYDPNAIRIGGDAVWEYLNKIGDFYEKY